MKNSEDIIRRLEGLEKENLRLKRELEKTGKSKVGALKPDHVTVYESKYQGHPVLKFSIGKRFFSMGLRRLAAVLAARDLIVAFVKRHDAGFQNWTVEYGGVVEDDNGADGAEDVKI